MSLFELGIVIIAVVLVLVAFLLKRGLVWAIPLAYCGVAFYKAVIDEYSVYICIPLAGFALLSLLIFNLKMFKGDII
jgi:hypothetical protein